MVKTRKRGGRALKRAVASGKSYTSSMGTIKGREVKASNVKELRSFKDPGVFNFIALEYPC